MDVPILALLCAVLLSTLPAEAQQPSRPSRGPALQVGPVLTYTESLGSTLLSRGLTGHLELGGSLPVGYEDNELYLMMRGGFRGARRWSLGVHGGLRSVYGQEEWQSFTELGVGVVLHPDPRAWMGPRLGVGVRRLLDERLSLYGGLGGQLGFGSGLRLDVEVFTGVRWGL